MQVAFFRYNLVNRLRFRGGDLVTATFCSLFSSTLQFERHIIPVGKQPTFNGVWMSILFQYISIKEVLINEYCYFHIVIINFQFVLILFLMEHFTSFCNKFGWDAHYLRPILSFIEEVLRGSTKQYDDTTTCKALTKYVEEILFNCRVLTLYILCYRYIYKWKTCLMTELLYSSISENFPKFIGLMSQSELASIYKFLKFRELYLCTII